MCTSGRFLEGCRTCRINYRFQAPYLAPSNWRHSQHIQRRGQRRGADGRCRGASLNLPHKLLLKCNNGAGWRRPLGPLSHTRVP